MRCGGRCYGQLARDRTTSAREPKTTSSATSLDDDEALEPTVTVEITGLSLYTQHGVSARPSASWASGW